MQGRDTVEANLDLGLPVDSRRYDVGRADPDASGPDDHPPDEQQPGEVRGARGISAAHRRTRAADRRRRTRRTPGYLSTKQAKLGHLLGLALGCCWRSSRSAAAARVRRKAEPDERRRPSLRRASPRRARARVSAQSEIRMTTARLRDVPYASSRASSTRSIRPNADRVDREALFPRENLTALARAGLERRAPSHGARRPGSRPRGLRHRRRGDRPRLRVDGARLRDARRRGADDRPLRKRRPEAALAGARTRRPHRHVLDEREGQRRPLVVQLQRGARATATTTSSTPRSRSRRAPDKPTTTWCRRGRRAPRGRPTSRSSSSTASRRASAPARGTRSASTATIADRFDTRASTCRARDRLGNEGEGKDIIYHGVSPVYLIGLGAAWHGVARGALEEITQVRDRHRAPRLRAAARRLPGPAAAARRGQGARRERASLAGRAGRAARRALGRRQAAGRDPDPADRVQGPRRRSRQRHDAPRSRCERRIRIQAAGRSSAPSATRAPQSAWARRTTSPASGSERRSSDCRSSSSRRAASEAVGNRDVDRHREGRDQRRRGR